MKLSKSKRYQLNSNALHERFADTKTAQLNRVSKRKLSRLRLSCRLSFGNKGLAVLRRTTS
jgi:hypothetical protein